MTRPLRVLVGLPFGEALGGAERFLRLVAEHAADHGLELRVVLNQPGPLESQLQGLGVQVDVVPLRRFRHLRTGIRAIAALRALIRAHQPDLVFSWLPRSHVYLAPAALVAGVPVGRIAWFQHHTPTGELLERLATLVPASAVVCGSETMAAAQKRLRPRRRTIVARPGIGTIRPIGTGELAALRAELGIPGGRSIVGLPGRFVRWKGQDRFVDALARLRAEGHDIHGLVVGGTVHGVEPEFAPTVGRRVAELGLEDRVTLTGQVPDPLPFIQLMDVLVNASECEPFGLTLVEAQALGVPAVAVGAGGPTEIIEHGESGWLVPSGDPGDLAAGIAAVLADPALAARLASGGRASYEARFTADAAVARLVGALRELVA